MPPFDGQAIGEEIVAAVKAYIAPLFTKIAELEAQVKELRDRPTPPLPLTKDEVHQIIQAIYDKKTWWTEDQIKSIAISVIPEWKFPRDEIAAMIPPPVDWGKQIQELNIEVDKKLSHVDAMIDEMGEKIPTPEQVREIAVESIVIPEVVSEKRIGEMIGAINTEVRNQLEILSVSINETFSSTETNITKQFNDWDAAMRAEISVTIKEAFDEIPKPKDGDPGKSVTIDDVRPLIERAVNDRVAAIPPAKDGVSFKSAIIDKDHFIVFTKTDGEFVRVGPIQGTPGQDGLGFGDLIASQPDDRTIVVKAKNGDKERDLITYVFKSMIYRHVFKEEQSYVLGDVVTWGGSMWHCEEPTQGIRPGEGSKNWTLCVKRGQEGKPGKDLRLIPDNPVVKV